MSSRPREATEVDVYIGNQIRMLRLLEKESQAYLGELLGVTFQQVQKYERGSNRLSASRLMVIAQHYQVSSYFFFEECENLKGKLSDKASSVTDLSKSAFGVKLADAIVKINDPEVRKQVLTMARMLGKFEAD